jgi:hypothetical protein
MSGTSADQNSMRYLFLYFCLYEINKPGFIYSERKNLPKKQELQKNMKIKPVCTMRVWNLITA